MSEMYNDENGDNHAGRMYLNLDDLGELLRLPAGMTLLSIDATGSGNSVVIRLIVTGPNSPVYTTGGTYYSPLMLLETN